MLANNRYMEALLIEHAAQLAQWQSNEARAKRWREECERRSKVYEESVDPHDTDAALRKALRVLAGINPRHGGRGTKKLAEERDGGAAGYRHCGAGSGSWDNVLRAIEEA